MLYELDLVRGARSCVFVWSWDRSFTCARRPGRYEGVWAKENGNIRWKLSRKLSHCILSRWFISNFNGSTFKIDQQPTKKRKTNELNCKRCEHVSAHHGFGNVSIIIPLTRCICHMDIIDKIDAFYSPPFDFPTWADFFRCIFSRILFSSSFKGCQM